MMRVLYVTTFLSCIALAACGKSIGGPTCVADEFILRPKEVLFGVGDTITMIARPDCSDGKVKIINWVSQHPDVATIEALSDSTAFIRAVRKGDTNFLVSNDKSVTVIVPVLVQD